jgi:hypothetical protein
MKLLLLATALLVAFLAPLSASDEQCPSCEFQNRHACAGWPQCISPWARPTYGCHEGGYYVGGGAFHNGDYRCAHEGTWGWDYYGRLFNKRIALGWHHGRRTQGGYGAYKSDGPRILPE